MRKLLYSTVVAGCEGIISFVLRSVGVWSVMALVLGRESSSMSLPAMLKK